MEVMAVLRSIWALCPHWLLAAVSDAGQQRKEIHCRGRRRRSCEYAAAP